MNQSTNSKESKPKEFHGFLFFLVRILGFLVFVLILFIISLRFGFVQNWTKEQVLKYINTNYQQDIEINQFYFNPFHGITAEILIRDHHQDTLLYTTQFQLGLLKSMITLYNGSLYMDEVVIKSSVVKIIKYKGEDNNNLAIFISKFNEENKSQSKPLNFNLKKVELSNSRILISKPDMEADIQFDQLNASIDSVNSLLNYYKFRKVLLENPSVHLIEYRQEDAMVARDTTPVIQKDTCDQGYGVAIDFINLNSGSFHLAIEKKDSFQHLVFNNIFFSCFNAYLSNDLTQFDFIHFNARGKDDFILRNAIVNHFKLDARSFTIDKLKIETSRSNLDLKIQFLFDPQAKNEDLIQKTVLKTEIAGSLIHPKDIEYFIPQWSLYNFIRLKTEFPFYFKGDIFGTLNNLKGKDIAFKYEDQFSFQGNIQARNLFLKDKELINLKINKLETKASFIRMIFPEYNIPPAYNRFGRIILNGDFDGFFDDFVAYGSFQTDLGVLKSDIKVKLSKIDKTALYSGSFSAIQLDIGKLLGNSDLGKVTMNSKIIDGKGLSKASLYANMEATISDLEFKNYHYKDIQFKGNVNKDLFQGELRIQDEHANLFIKGGISNQNNLTKIQLSSQISNLNLKDLNLSEDSLNYSGTINCNITGSQESDVNGYFEANNSNLFIHDHSIEIKKIHLEQRVSNKNRKITLNSDFINSEMEGTFTLSTLKNDLLSFLTKKYPGLANVFPMKDSSKVNPAIARGYLYIKDGSVVSQLFNIPLQVDKADCDFSFDNKNNLIEITSNRFDLSYKEFYLSKLSVDIVGSQNLNMLLTSDYFQKDDKKVFGNFKFSTNYNGKTGQSSIQLFDSTNAKIVMNATSVFSYFKDTFKLSFNNKDLFINNDRWKINEKNTFLKSRNTLQFSNFELTDSIHFISVQDYNQKGVILKSDGLDISLINQFIKTKTIAFYGLFSSEIRIPDLSSLSGSSVSIHIFQMHFNRDNFGPFDIDVAIDDSMSPWRVKVKNVFHEHIIEGEGHINIPIKPSNYAYVPFDFNVDLNLKAFPMSFLENFISTISKTSGSADGKMKFYSVNNELNITGDLNVVNGTTFINYLGVPVVFKNQLIKFRENSILFDQVIMEDKLGNPISVNGSLNHTHLKNLDVEIRVLSDKAFLLDTKKEENVYYYGSGYGSVDAKFSGLLGKMDLDVNIATLKGTRINIPIDNKQETSESKFVKFVNHQTPTQNQTTVVGTTISGLNLNMQLSMTDDAEVSIIFDTLAGDILKGHGRGNLIIKSLRNNLFTVNGNYEVDEGQYLFTLYNYVNKPFALKKGGTISWTGDPIDANLNIEAVYEGVYTSITPLIQEYLVDLSAQEDAKQKTAANVRMLLTGSLLKPSIKFDIELPDYYGINKVFVDQKLKFLRDNEDQLNQQVFGLIVLRSFINTNNFQGIVNAGNLKATAINTFSEMLFKQASLFVSNLLINAHYLDFVSGVDFNIGWDLSNSSIGAAATTESQIVFSLKHRLFNDKWAFTVGANYKSNPIITPYGNSNFNPESVLEWNTPVNGLKLRIYYKADESIEGVKHKIGTGVTFRKEFDSFSDFENELKARAQKYKQEHHELQ